jgi:hypothetical protein
MSQQGKAETGADDILHSVTILVKSYLLSPRAMILAGSLRVLQTKMDGLVSQAAATFSNSSPAVSWLLTHSMNAPCFVKLTFCA